jgi:hypothetical protein
MGSFCPEELEGLLDDETVKEWIEIRPSPKENKIPLSLALGRLG